MWKDDRLLTQVNTSIETEVQPYFGKCTETFDLYAASASSLITSVSQVLVHFLNEGVFIIFIYYGLGGGLE